MECPPPPGTTMIVDATYSEWQSAKLSCANILQIRYPTNYASTSARVVSSCCIDPNNRSSYVRRSSMSLVQNVSQRIPQFDKNVSKTSAKSLNTRIQAAFGSRKPKVHITPLTKFRPETPYEVKTLHAKYFQNRNCGFPII